MWKTNAIITSRLVCRSLDSNRWEARSNGAMNIENHGNIVADKKNKKMSCELLFLILQAVKGSVWRAAECFVDIYCSVWSYPANSIFRESQVVFKSSTEILLTSAQPAVYKRDKTIKRRHIDTILSYTTHHPSKHFTEVILIKLTHWKVIQKRAAIVLR